MESLYTGILVVDHKFHPSTRRFAVETPYNARIEYLKQKAQEKRPELSSYIPSDLGVWRMKGNTVMKKLSPQGLSEALGRIDVKDETTIEELYDEEKLADLGLSDYETLLLQVPAPITHDSPFGDAITTDVNPEYKHCFLKAKSQGRFVHEDIEFNAIYDSVPGISPGFVARHEGVLGQRRSWPLRCARRMEGLIDEGLFAEYFCSAEESSESSPIVDLPEVHHIIHLSSVNARWLEPRFQESDAYSLYFIALTTYYEALAPPVSHGEPIITVKQSSDPWYFHHLIQVGDELHTYKPKNGFLLLKHGLPRLAVQISSTQKGPSVDLMLQGASIVRFANTMLDAYKQEKDFVFVAIYIESNGQANRYVLYQDERIDPRNPHNVYRKVRTFKLAEVNERMKFALELYNLGSTWNDDEYTKEQVDKLKDAVREASKTLPTFTGGTGSKCPASPGGGRHTPTEEDQDW